MDPPQVVEGNASTKQFSCEADLRHLVAINFPNRSKSLLREWPPATFVQIDVFLW